ncbi:FAD-dependent oxidoreductase [Roseiarcaceae bacterium H3SJ34-1]|uniref:dihydrolipoyl dehydrogenase family protein n=1 Tax=Terripilifer ovatus TaxID=3032367 RepID=UPI003AB986B8|nr:FAD-dependent oxidoreductase [Roseiarcaceae bacterium H3SJ34-1]
MTETLTPDICIIGGGAGGFAVAAGAAAFGVAVVLIEKGEMGGDDLNYGSVPAQVLRNAGSAAHVMTSAQDLGLAPVQPAVDMAALQQRIRATIAGLAPAVSEARLTAMNVRVVRAAARFVSSKAVDAGDVRIEARRFVIATGSSPTVPKIAGLEYVRALTNETVFDLRELPQRLIIAGASRHGLELAQAFRRLGSEVIVLDARTVLSDMDPEFVDHLLGALTREGIEIRQNVKIERIEPDGKGIRAIVASGAQTDTVVGSHLLITAGRSANVHNLGLEQAGIAFGPDGIKVRANLRTSNRRVYAIGDVAQNNILQDGSAQAAQYQAGLVLRSLLFRQSAAVVPGLVPQALYTDPEIAVVGQQDDGAGKLGLKTMVYRWPFAETEKARAALGPGGHGPANGHIKVIVAPNGQILGAGIVGPQASELIAPWQLAIAKKLKIGDMADLIVPHPSFSEVSRRASLMYYSVKLHSSLLQSVIGLLRKLG